MDEEKTMELPHALSDISGYCDWSAMPPNADCSEHRAGSSLIVGTLEGVSETSKITQTARQPIVWSSRRKQTPKLAASHARDKKENAKDESNVYTETSTGR